MFDTVRVREVDGKVEILPEDRERGGTGETGNRESNVSPDEMRVVQSRSRVDDLGESRGQGLVGEAEAIGDEQKMLMQEHPTFE